MITVAQNIEPGAEEEERRERDYTYMCVSPSRRLLPIVLTWFHYIVRQQMSVKKAMTLTLQGPSLQGPFHDASTISPPTASVRGAADKSISCGGTTCLRCAHGHSVFSLTRGHTDGGVTRSAHAGHFIARNMGHGAMNTVLFSRTAHPCNDELWPAWWAFGIRFPNTSSTCKAACRCYASDVPLLPHAFPMLFDSEHPAARAL
ncbi:hypothetical protein A0H81_01749 [Grifola frondosa]|uniref:Uncharacterized protein n=1 Tax=Grifola frondosa TaxID=5627 RepID=A0A1C7ML43_GRIFR|nr:hypothetical protein A0H81_01749 [Grifola frondosa]